MCALSSGQVCCLLLCTDPELGVETATEDWFTVTSSSNYFDFFDSSGFTLQVPDGALPPEDPSCTVEVKSVAPGESGAFVYPDNSKPISAIYHISSSTAQLCRPVEFTMEHFGLQEDPSKTSSCKFVAASSMDDLPYKFSFVPERYNFQTSDGQVTLESLAPTFLAIVQEEANGPGQHSAAIHIYISHTELASDDTQWTVSSNNTYKVHPN